MKKIITIFIVLLMIFTLAACGKDDGGNQAATEVTAVKISGKAQVKLGGADLQLTATVVPSNLKTTFRSKKYFYSLILKNIIEFAEKLIGEKIINTLRIKIVIKSIN